MAEAQTLSNVELAVDWLARTPERDRPHSLLIHLRKTFGLNTTQLCKVIDEYQKQRGHR